MILQVTPNGPYGKDTHPAMPVSLDELLAELQACVAAGANGVHLHPRDASGAETLDPAVVNETCRQVRELDPSLEIGLTTGAWIEPDLANRVAMIREWEGVDCATVNLCENGFETVMTAMLDTGIGIDVGLWAPIELDRLLQSGLLESAFRVSIELGPGEPYHLSGDPLDHARLINDRLDAASPSCPRLTHGEDQWVWPLLTDALRRGHDVRVGFEDSTRLPDGTVAANNAQLLSAALALRDRG